MNYGFTSHETTKETDEAKTTAHSATGETKENITTKVLKWIQLLIATASN